MSKVVSLPILNQALTASTEESKTAQGKFESQPEPTVNRAAISALSVTMQTLTEAIDARPALHLAKVKSDLQPFILKAAEIEQELSDLAKVHLKDLDRLCRTDWTIAFAVYSKADRLRTLVNETISGLAQASQMSRIRREVDQLDEASLLLDAEWRIKDRVNGVRFIAEHIRESLAEIGEHAAKLQTLLQGAPVLEATSIDRSSPGSGRQERYEQHNPLA